MADHSLVRGLVRDWETVAEHEGKSDPHPQYAFAASVLANFAFSAYGAMEYDGVVVGFPDLGAGWQNIDIFNSLPVATPRHVTVNLGGSTVAVDTPGVFAITITISINHNSSNSGRTTRVRLFDVTDGQPLGDGYVIGTGRNAEATTASATILAELGVDDVNHDLIVQIGGGAIYTSVEFNAATFSIYSVGEYRGELERVLPPPEATIFFLKDDINDQLIDDLGNSLIE